MERGRDRGEGMDGKSIEEWNEKGEGREHLIIIMYFTIEIFLPSNST